MNQVTINGDALRDVLSALLGKQGADIVDQAYLVVDAAEKRGQAQGFVTGNTAGFEAGYRAGESQGYNIGYDHGIEDGKDEAAFAANGTPCDPATINDLPSDCEFPHEAEAAAYEPFATRTFFNGESGNIETIVVR